MSFTGVISYPIPLYQNLPIHAEYYQPRRYVISGITRGQTTIVTTSTAHDYVIGQQVRLIIPSAYGTYQLNEAFGYVISIPTTTSVEIDIVSANDDAFIAATNPQDPQIMAIGDVNSGVVNTQGRINQITKIPGSFIDISPA